MVIYPDNNPGGPSAISNDKDVHVKSCLITTSDTFSTTVLKAVLPADSTVLGIQFIIPTGTATATISVGDAGSATAYVNAASAATAGQFWPTLAKAGNVSTGGTPLGADARITVTVGTATLTTAVYMNIYYVR